ncbi:monooxygenase [Cupriavidus sp. TA19]|uniref:LLM class flavin-dependent oxidoreductase n=1 Tax=unclassified Cupriavidus TaxID=2640874 RepID=UPI0027294B8E|nr:LLM class flavin-dependent oxidoreductase [Cupriavidus sp. TA19]GLC90812.1 monooxygenase [Cupriavidus sp. TA19]
MSNNLHNRRLHLNLFIHGRGHHEAGWRHPRATRQALTDIGYFRQLARTAEAGCFDSVFLADALALGDGIEHVAGGALEPLTAVAALAGATERIGLIATASTTYSEPFNLARQFASLDHLSGGRVGWNIVTSWVQGANRNFGLDTQPPHAERYARSHDFLEAVTKLWDSWDDDAVIDDPHGGQYVRPAGVRPVDHVGPFHRVAGPLNLPRGPQGRPVLVQAGSSDAGKAFAARHAEAVFTAHLQKDTAISFYRELKERARLLGREPGQIIILPGISPVIGSTDDEAQRHWDELNALTAPSVGLARLSNRFGGHDFSHLDLDKTLSVQDFPDPATVQAAQSRAVVITALVERERPTLRELLHKLAGARGHYTIAGSPQRIADTIEDWFASGAADGFNVMPPVLPAHLDDFVEHVVPILQRKGLFRYEYDARTLRGHYGLERPGVSAR